MKSPKTFENLLAHGIHDFEAGSYEAALLQFRRAVIADFSRPEAWFWIGRLHEELGQAALAAHGYYMACDMRAGFALAKAGLRRLGYINGQAPAGAAAAGSWQLLFQGAS